MENENLDMGFVEHSIRKIEQAGTQIVQQGYNGIYVDIMDFFSHEAELVHVEDTRSAVNDAQKVLYEQKNGKIKAEKLDFEHLKSAQANAKLNLEMEHPVHLRIGLFNNLAQWLLQILKKHKEVSPLRTGIE